MDYDPLLLDGLIELVLIALVAVYLLAWAKNLFLGRDDEN